MLTVFADQHLFKAREIVPDEIDLRFYDPEKGLPAPLDEVDALLIRTVTGINAGTLGEPPPTLKFVGTGSAGTDHVDTDFLAAHGIRFAHSAGCNARSVAEYVVTSLIIWSDRNNIDLEQEIIGIVGVGHVGTVLQQMCDDLGWQHILFDPPRAEREKAFKSAELVELLEASILTFHTPLHDHGVHSTYHWLNHEYLADHRFKLVINTSRGGVVDEQALLRAISSGTVDDMIIDVWENEPNFDNEVAENAFIATPHIAGYSVQAKYRATKMVVDQMIEHFSLDLPVNKLTNSKEAVCFEGQDIETLSLAQVLQQVHPVQQYADALNKLVGLAIDLKKKRFNRLRTSMPFRNEYTFLKVPEPLVRRFPVLSKLGISPPA
ncbi:4-phosphoerythronate dehydrogenase [Halalkalibaculum sp. DA3122]|uniref:4-phosphoerythronate dehydrogenase n=1 Tax=Halalkalibaculum sp. DA3122 TaxID=3373607 RepID=UPI003754E1F8